MPTIKGFKMVNGQMDAETAAKMFPHMPLRPTSGFDPVVKEAVDEVLANEKIEEIE